MATVELTPAELSSRGASLGSTGVLSDEAIGRLVSNGDERAFEVLYERYSAVLFRYCKTILRSDDDAEEAFQATMMNAYRALTRGRGGNTMRPWLYQIAHNQCVSTIRSRRPVERLGDHEVAQTGTVHEQVEIQEQVRQLRTDLESLPAMQRSALVMREMSGLSHRAIGDALETSPSDARQLVYEARQSLSEFSAGRELDCDEVQHRISDGDRRRLRGRRVRAHLRSCAGCDAFAKAQTDRRRTLASFFPVLPAAASLKILEEILASGGGMSAGAAGVGSAGSLGSTAATGSGGVATAGTGMAGVGAGLSGVVGSTGTVAGIGGLAASGLLKAGSGTAAAGPAGMISTTTAGGVASAGVAALSVIVAAAVTIGGGQAPMPAVEKALATAPAVKVNVSGSLPAAPPVPASEPIREGAIARDENSAGGAGAPAEPIAPTAVAEPSRTKTTKVDPGAIISGPAEGDGQSSREAQKGVGKEPGPEFAVEPVSEPATGVAPIAPLPPATAEGPKPRVDGDPAIAGAPVGDAEPALADDDDDSTPNGDEWPTKGEKKGESTKGEKTGHEKAPEVALPIAADTKGAPLGGSWCPTDET